jgi:hypothetical protein
VSVAVSDTVDISSSSQHSHPKKQLAVCLQCSVFFFSLSFSFSVFFSLKYPHQMASVLSNEQSALVVNPALFQNKRNLLVSGGSENLQVVSDFDRTLSAFKINGKLSSTTFGILEVFELKHITITHRSLNSISFATDSSDLSFLFLFFSFRTPAFSVNISTKKRENCTSIIILSR